ncbi:MAG: PadR family transcriptional regulator [Candidatus Micrarchaeaceae archaeon]
MRGRMNRGFEGEYGESFEGRGRGGVGMGRGMIHMGRMGFPMQRGFVGLRYWILNLTSRRELTGAQIMAAMSEMSMGGWSPSPGNVYPALKSMVEDGYLEQREEDAKKYYKATEKGRQLLENLGWPIGREMGMGYAKRPGMEFEWVTGDADVIERLDGYIEYLKDHASEIKGDKALREKIEKLKKELDALI